MGEAEARLLVRALAWGQPFSALCALRGLWLKLASPLLPESLTLGSGEARAALGHLSQLPSLPVSCTSWHHPLLINEVIGPR